LNPPLHSRFLPGRLCQLPEQVAEVARLAVVGQDQGGDHHVSSRITELSSEVPQGIRERRPPTEAVSQFRHLRSDGLGRDRRRLEDRALEALVRHQRVPQVLDPPSNGLTSGDGALGLPLAPEELRPGEDQKGDQHPGYRPAGGHSSNEASGSTEEQAPAPASAEATHWPQVPAWQQADNQEQQTDPEPGTDGNRERLHCQNPSFCSKFLGS
jgi:hypothetical protein